MTERLLEAVRTPIDLRAYSRAVARAWRLLLGAFPTKAQAGVLWAQYGIETGAGPFCWNWNIGNVKHVAGDGHDYVALNGVWEGVSAAEAERLISSGQAVLDPKAEHQRAVGTKRVAVVFQPPHPATFFRAFPDLDTAMAEHLGFLRNRRYLVAWAGVEAGDCRRFAELLKAQGYFTASVDAYAAGMRGHFQRWMASDAFDEALLELVREQERPTTPEGLDPPPSEPTRLVDFPIAFALPDTVLRCKACGLVTCECPAPEGAP